MTSPTTASGQPPPDYPTDWTFDVVVKDGATVRLRPILPDDAPGLQSLISRMGRESIYHRFFRIKTTLTADELAYFTQLNYSDRMAFVAIHEGQIVGVGRYDRSKEDPRVAEVAFAMADAHQGRGIGTRLLEQLTDYAREHGIEAFRAFVLADNHAMIRVFRNAGYLMHRELDEGVYTVEFPTADSPEVLAAEAEHEKRSVAASLLPVFYPNAVAVIGASRNPTSIGGRLFRNLLQGDFSGPVFPVNPNAEVVRSVKAYPSILEVPGRVDLAFIVVPAPHVMDAVDQCAAKGVKGLVVISAGFSEVGGEGAELEAQLLEKVRSAGMRMVGPNCMGVLNTDPVVSMDGQFGPLFPPRGNVGFSSQSGALGIAILDYTTRLNIGISTFVSVGNKADISGNDLLLYWEDDPATDVIVLYLESFGNPRRFARIARRIGKRKPIVAVKSGRTSAGARAASSHTGSLATLDIAADALFRQAGVIRADTLEQLFDVTALLATQPIPVGRRVAVLTNAGGPGILAVDALESNGLVVPELSEDLQVRLQEHLSSAAAVRNPIDMIASAGPDEYRRCLEELRHSDEVDSVIVIHIPAAPEGLDDIAAAISEAAAGYATHDKTLLAVMMRAGGAPRALAMGEVPVYRFPEAAARALARVVKHGEWRVHPDGEVPHLDGIDEKAANAVVSGALAAAEVDEDGLWLDPEDVDAVLRAFGLDLPRAAVAASADDAVAIAAEFESSAVLKVISPSALHKSDVGGIALDVAGESEVRQAFAAVTGAVPDASGALVQEYVPGGHEVIIGMTEDPTFGPLIAFGLGGVFVELIGDVAFRIHPLTDVDAAEMIGDVKSARLLEGYRGAPPGDIPALREALLRVSALVEAVPEIVEMDLNPVKVGAPGEGVRPVDARIRVRPVHGSWVPSRRDIPSAV